MASSSESLESSLLLDSAAATFFTATAAFFTGAAAANTRTFHLHMPNVTDRNLCSLFDYLLAVKMFI